VFLFRKHLSLPLQRGSARPAGAGPTRNPFHHGAKLQRRIRHLSRLRVPGWECFWGAERKFWQLGEGIYVTRLAMPGGLPQIHL